jgi:hypothetical protein
LDFPQPPLKESFFAVVRDELDGSQIAAYGILARA